jgi:glycosyltransferase involved in cell wall biosynthesis
MNLCHIVPSLQERHGGPSKSVRALCRALARAGHVTELLTTAPDAPPRGFAAIDPTTGLNVRTFRRDWPQRICPSHALAAAVRASPAEIVHHHALWLRTLHYAHAQSKRSRVPLVLSPRGMMSHWAWNHRRLRKQISEFLIHPGAFKAVNGWHATSEGEHDDIRALGFKQPICVAPNGVDAPAQEEIEAARNYWHEVCPETATRPTALFYGRFHQKKRLIELIDVWIEHTPREWLLLLVGIPEDYTPAVLEEYALKLSAAGRVRAFAGPGRPAPYAAANLFVLPSHNENFGLAVAEALAHGVPAVVTDTTPWLQLNEDRRGWCVPWAEFGSALQLATKESSAALHDRGLRAQTWAVGAYSWIRTAQQLGEFYQGLASNV